MSSTAADRVAVVGGGSAGFMAAAHLSTRFPELDLLHIYDSSLPPLGVGEGTLPSFPVWLHATTGLELDELQDACAATLKLGVRFEGWGRENPVFHNDFSARAYGYHLSASRLPTVLEPVIRARRLDRRVKSLVSNGRRVRLRFADGEALDADLVFDARGFPGAIGSSSSSLAPIPTNAALLRSGPVARLQGGTRAVARRHGWIFGIPLTSHTSYGYIYNDSTASLQAVRSDFHRFFVDEGIVAIEGERQLRFPNFCRRFFFDGALFRIGNAASFLEPLEATSLGSLLLQLQVASSWMGNEMVDSQDKWHPGLLAALNRYLRESIEAVALFISWHYSRGSRWDTPFWRHAQRAFDHAWTRLRHSRIGLRFRELLAAGAKLPRDAVMDLRDPENFDRHLAPRLEETGDLGGFDALSFAQVGLGLGALIGGAGSQRVAVSQNEGNERP